MLSRKYIRFFKYDYCLWGNAIKCATNISYEFSVYKIEQIFSRNITHFSTPIKIIENILIPIVQKVSPSLFLLPLSHSDGMCPFHGTHQFDQPAFPPLDFKVDVTSVMNVRNYRSSSHS